MTAATVRRPGAGGTGRDRLVAAWRSARWPIFGVVVAGAAALGFIGLGRYYDDLRTPRSAMDLLYATLQLFVLESGSITGPLPWQLEVARFLAPATTATAVVVTLAAVFSDQLAAIRLLRSRRHIVVCGLGEQGDRLARALLAAGYRVVAIDDDPGDPRIPELRRQGALVIVGDPRRADSLRRARVTDAGTVVALADSDDINAEVVIRAGALAGSGSRRPALACLAHVQDTALCELLRARQLAGGYEPGFRLDFFNVVEQGARALLRDHLPAPDGPQAPSLAVIGLTALGRAVIVEAARQWRYAGPGTGHRLSITVIDPSAASVVRELEQRYPQLGRLAEVRWAGQETGYRDLAVLAEGAGWCTVVVCIHDPSVAVHVALQARQALGNRAGSVVVELDRSPGMTELVEHSAACTGVSAFDLHDASLRPELLLGGTYEVLARAIHDDYVAGEIRSGTAAGNPSAVAWDELPEALRESNRDQAAHIGVKLAALGCGISPLGDWDADRLRFSDAEVERLAEMEHRRWVDQRVRDGWTLGSRDVGRKTSPYLVPWDQLADDVRELDRQAVRGIPTFLARAGYQVTRGPTAGTVEGSLGGAMT